MIKMGVLAIIVWEVFIATLFWTAGLFDNLEAKHFWVSLQVMQKTMWEKECHSDVLHWNQGEPREPSFPLVWEPLASVAGIS